MPSSYTLSPDENFWDSFSFSVHIEAFLAGRYYTLLVYPIPSDPAHRIIFHFIGLFGGIVVTFLLMFLCLLKKLWSDTLEANQYLTPLILLIN